MTGLWIPEEVLKIEGLDFLSKGLFSQILALKPCYASNSYFAQMFGVTTRTISSSLSNLEKMKLIESKIDKVNGNARTIKAMENISIPNVNSSIPMEISSIPPMENISIPMEISSNGQENISIPIENISSHIKEENKVENKLKTNLKQSINVEISKNEIYDHTQNDLISSDNILTEPQKKIDEEKAPQTGGAGAVEDVDKLKRVWVDGQGDGELHALLAEYFKDPSHPKYEPEMYKKFKAYWTALVRVGTGKGKELWRTEKTFNIALRLSTWKNNELRTANNWGKNRKDIPLAPIGTEPTNGRKFGKL